MTRGLGALGCDCVRCSGYFSEENMANQSGIVCSQELEAFLATCRDGNVRLVKVRWVGLFLRCQLISRNTILLASKLVLSIKTLIMIKLGI